MTPDELVKAFRVATGSWHRQKTVSAIQLGWAAADWIEAELAELAKRPDCPTCGGKGDTLDLICDNCGASASLPLGMTCSNHLAKPSPCPDCDGAGKVSVERMAALWNYVHECRVEAPDVLHYVSDTHYDHRTDKAYNLLAVLRGVS